MEAVTDLNYEVYSSESPDDGETKPRHCPQCGWGELAGPDPNGDVTCIECGFVFDMDECGGEA